MKRYPPPDAVKPCARMKLLLLLLFLAGQLLGVLHLAEHGAHGETSHCGICLDASHLGDAVAPAPAVDFVLQQYAATYAKAAFCFIASLTCAACASRAPPA